TEAGVDCETRRGLEIVLDEVFLIVRARTQDLLLNIDREGLYLSQQETRQGISVEARQRRSDRRNRLRIRKQRAEAEVSRRRRRLNHVEPLPAKVDARFQRMPA